MNTIIICGIFMSFFIAFLLHTKKYKGLTDRILAYWVTFIGIHLLGYYFYHLGYWDKYPHMIGLYAPFPLIYGPMLYLYTLYSLRGDVKLRIKDYLHFTPVVFSYLYMSDFFFFYTAEQKRMVDSGQLPDYGIFMAFLLVGYIVSGFAYSILSYRLTWQHKRKVDENFSYDEGISLSWLRKCIYGIGIVFLASFVVIILRYVVDWEFNFNVDYIVYSVIIIFIFYLGYNGIRHQNMFTHNTEMSERNSATSVADEKYQRSGLTLDSIQEGHRRVLELMKENKPFLNPKLSLSQLATQLGITSNQLSQIINQQEQVNFHDFINRYRIDEFISRASSNPDFSFLAHAFDSGFNSKSSFNGVFKKIKGMTPSQYMAQTGLKDTSR